MSSSTATLTPGAVAPGVGAVAETRHRLAMDALDVRRAMLDRAGRGDYWRWLAHVQAAAGCTRPVRLAGQIHTVDTGTGEVTSSRSTSDLPDAVIYKACGNRRAAVCPSCSETYRADAYQLVLAGLAGGKGVPATAAGHSAVFATLTAPSFGPVHTRTASLKTGRLLPCHADRRHPICAHGRRVYCGRRHSDGDQLLGQPLCPDCYDHRGQAVWNASASELWRRTRIGIDRAMTRHRPPGAPPVRVSYGKTAEFQRRGVVHYHAILRLDGIHPADPDAVLPPPEWASVFVLAHVLREAVARTRYATVPHPDRPAGWVIGWGDPDKGLDIRPIRYPGDRHIDRTAVAGYLAKYATKSTETTGHVSQRLTPATIGLYADDTHPGRLIAAAWTLGRPAAGPEWTRLRRWAHQLGHGGHFFTKSRRYSTTFTVLRAARASWRRRHLERDRADQHQADAVVVVAALEYAGLGWHTTGDALLANTSAALARERRRAARDEIRSSA